MNPTELSSFNLPALLVGTLVVAAAVAYLLQSWERITCLVAALLTGGFGLWLWQVDLSYPTRQLPFVGQTVDLTAPWVQWGFTFQFQAGSLPIVAICLLLTSAACLLSAHVSQGASLAPLALLLTAGYSLLALMVAGPLAPPLISPLFLITLSSLSVFLLQGGRLTQPNGPVRILIPPVLAFPLFLVAFWYVDQIPLNPQDFSPQRTATQLLGLGMLLLLSPVPLHSAQPVTAQSAPPVTIALASLLYQLTLLHLLFRLTLLYPFLGEVNAFHEWLAWTGLATAIWGGVAAAGTNQPGRLWGYAALHDWGLLILVLAVPGLRSWLLVLTLFGLRAVSMLTAAAGLAVMEAKLGELSPARLRGVATRLPWNSVAFLLGGLGLVGFPLSAGFTGHWAALQLIAEEDWIPAAIVLLASGGAIFSFIRLTREMFGPLQNRLIGRESLVSALVAILVLLLSVSLAVVPQWLGNPITRILAALRG